MTTAKVFKNGRSQAVRLPKELRFDCDEVYIKRVGSAVLLFPTDKGWDLMRKAVEQFDEDFMAERDQGGAVEERKPL